MVNSESSSFSIGVCLKYCTEQGKSIPCIFISHDVFVVLDIFHFGIKHPSKILELAQLVYSQTGDLL